MDYVPHTEEDIKKMLKFLGVSSIEELYAGIPKELLMNKPLNLPVAASEPEIMMEMRDLTMQNPVIRASRDFRGGGIERHYIPPIVPYLLGRGEFLTAYTPYQPEMSQGFLQAMFEYQTMVCELTGMDVSNASSYDGGTALGDALIIAAFHKHKSKRVLLSGGLNPNYRQVLETYNVGLEVELFNLKHVNGELDEENVMKEIANGARAIIIQTPNFFGIVENPSKIKRIGEAIKKNDGILIISSHPISLALLKTPGEMGADIAVGEAQSLGSFPNFGGPVLGYFTTNEKYLRKLPGRVIGETVDEEGTKAYVMTLQAREQHIRREKATSNLCTNQALVALGAAIYMSWCGKEGVKKLATRMASLAHYAMRKLSEVEGIHLVFPKAPHFHEFVINVDGDAEKIINEIYTHGYAAGIPLKNLVKDMPNGILISLKECNSRKEIDELARFYGDLL